MVELFSRTAASHPTRPALRRWENGEWVACTWAEYALAVTEVANGLRAAGLVPGDRVAILAANRPEWHIADLGALAAGLVSVPIYPSNSAKQVAYVLGHSQARCCFLDDADQLAKVVGRRDELPDLEFVVLLAGDHDDPDARFVRSLLDLRRAGANGQGLASLVEGVGPADLATIVYTSGTTGPPKGTMITHANIMATMRSLKSLIELRPDDRFLSFLPLSHITERSVSHFGQIAAGAETWFARSFATVAEDLRACRPTLFFGVPRVWEKFRQGILERVEEQPHVLRSVASRYLAASGRGQDASRGLGARVAAAEHTALDAVVGRKLRRQLGLDRARLLACGAAPVDPELLRWFHGIGLPVAEGYGMTEVSLCTSLNRPGDVRIGTVGPPVPGVSVQISAEGEILVRGDNVCAGYWRDPDASSELVDAAGGSTPVISDGWMPMASSRSRDARRPSSSRRTGRTSRRR